MLGDKQPGELDQLIGRSCRCRRVVLLHGWECFPEEGWDELCSHCGASIRVELGQIRPDVVQLELSVSQLPTVRSVATGEAAEMPVRCASRRARDRRSVVSLGARPERNFGGVVAHGDIGLIRALFRPDPELAARRHFGRLPSPRWRPHRIVESGEVTLTSSRGAAGRATR